MDIREIAKRAKVSTATVSRTINRIATVDPRLSNRVWRVVTELGYYPNTQARALVSGCSRTFGLIVSEITNPFFPEVIQAFEDIAVQNNYEILLTSTGHDPRRVELSVRRLIEKRVDGVAVMTFGLEDLLLSHVSFRNVPLVFVDVGPCRPRVSNIRIDYLHGIRQAVQHLAALGHKQLGFITGPLDLKSALARRRAFMDAVKGLGLAYDRRFLIEGDHTLEGGMRAMEQVLAARQRPTAILCSNDMTAIGVIRKSYECGVGIPEELSLIGFDDIRLANYVVPPLTTVQMSQVELARLAFQALLDDVQRKKPAPHGSEYILQTSLVVRDSTARPLARTVSAKSPSAS